MLWLLLVLLLGPPTVLAAFRPLTPRWRRARQVYWVALPVTLGLFALNLTAVDPAGPAGWYYGAWGAFVVVLAVLCWAIGIVRAEWSRRDETRERVAAANERVEQWKQGVGQEGYEPVTICTKSVQPRDHGA
jgi:hypothetical protein